MMHPHLIMRGERIQEIDSIGAGTDTFTGEQDDFSGEALLEEIGNVQAGNLLLLPQIISSVEVGPKLGAASLVAVAGFEKGRKASQCGVRFGQLFIDDNYRSITEHVAVKYAPPDKLAREYTASRIVDRRFWQ